MSFAEKLRALRTYHGLTQAELARLLGLNDHSHIAHLERPRLSDSQKADIPSLELVYAVARLFDISTDYLLRNTLPVEPLPPSGITSDSPVSVGITALGDKVRNLRQQYGWSLTALGQELGSLVNNAGYTRYYLSNLETGRRLPSINLLIQLADVFETTTDYFLRDEIPVRQQPHEEQRDSLEH